MVGVEVNIASDGRYSLEHRSELVLRPCTVRRPLARIVGVEVEYYLCLRISDVRECLFDKVQQEGIIAGQDISGSTPDIGSQKVGTYAPSGKVNVAIVPSSSAIPARMSSSHSIADDAVRDGTRTIDDRHRSELPFNEGLLGWLLDEVSIGCYQPKLIRAAS